MRIIRYTSNKVSFIEIFKYTTIFEKLLILFGFLFHLSSGILYPIIINYLGQFVDIFISLIINVSIKRKTGIQDDTIIEEYINLTKKNGQINSFDKYSNINLQNLKDNFNYTKDSFNSTNTNYQFKPLNNISEEFNYQLKFLLILIGILFLIGAIGSFISFFIANRYTNRIRALLFRSIINPNYRTEQMNELFDDHHYFYVGNEIRENKLSEFSSAIIIETLSIRNLIISLCNSFRYGALIITSLVVFFLNGFKIPLYLVLIFIGYILLISMVNTIFALIQGIYFGSKSKYSESLKYLNKIGKFAKNSLSNITTIIKLGNQKVEIERMMDTLENAFPVNICLSKIAGYTLGFNIIILMLLIYFLIKITIGFVRNGEISSGILITTIASGLLCLGSYYYQDRNQLYLNEHVKVSAEIIYMLEEGIYRNETESIYENQDGKQKGLLPNEPLKGHIDFNLNGSDCGIMPNVKFTCQPGETIAIVEETNLGKSKILELLINYSHIKSDSLLIDGYNIKELNSNWLNKQIGYYNGNSYLLNISIAENISLAHPEATQNQIEEAAKMANIHRFIMTLPKGYQTIGDQCHLTKCQKKCICLARAFLLRPKILLLDEPFRELDETTRKSIIHNLNNTASERTTIVSTKYLSFIQNADKIIVFGDNTLEEMGTHKSLLEKKGYYYYLLVSNGVINNANTNEEENTNDDNGNHNNQENISNFILDVDNITLLNKKLSKSSISSLPSSYSSSNSSLFLSFPHSLYDEILELNTTNSQSLLNDQKIKKNKNKNSFNWKRYRELSNKGHWSAKFNNIIGFIGTIFNGVVYGLYIYIYSSSIIVFTESNVTISDKMSHLLRSVLILCGLFCITQYIKVYNLAKASRCIFFNIFSEMYSSLLYQDNDYFEDIKIGTEKDCNMNSNKKKPINEDEDNLLTKLTNYPDISSKLNIDLCNIPEKFMLIIVVCIIALYCDWKISLLIMVIIPFALISTVYNHIICSRSNNKISTIYENTIDFISNSLLNIHTIQYLHQEDRIFKIFSKTMRKDSFIQKVQELLFMPICIGFNQILIGSTLICGLWSIYYFIVNKKQMNYENAITAAVMIIILIYIIRDHSYPNLENYHKAFNHSINIIDHNPLVDARSPDGEILPDINKSIEFKNLLVTEENEYCKKRNILLNFNKIVNGNHEFKVEMGKNVSIEYNPIIANNAYIIFKVLLRMHDVDRGEILIDGHKFTDMNVQWLRRQISVITSKPSLLEMTIKENICYGKVDATEEEMIESAKKAGIHDYIKTLPLGYETLLVENKLKRINQERLMRIGLARSFIRKAKILLIDYLHFNNEKEVKEFKSVIETIINDNSINHDHFVLIITRNDIDFENINTKVKLVDGHITKIENL